MAADILDYDHWLEALDKYARTKGFQGRPIYEQTGREAWRSFYDDGYTPEDALDEDWSNA